MRRIVVAIALAATVLASHGQSVQNDTRSRRAVVASGEAAYLRVGCQACHGTVGHGGAAKALAPNTLPLAAFRTWVRNGSPGWTVASGMPAFSPSALGDAELADVREFLASQPVPRAAADVPLLDP